MIGDIIKAIILYRIATSPMTMVVATMAFCVLLLLAGAFVKFKNGIFSWLCYFVVLAVPLVYTLLTISSIMYPPEDLQLSKLQTTQYIDICAEGVIVKKGFRRQQTLPLLGITTIQEDRLDSIKKMMGDYYPDKTITYKTSKVYDGVILYDSEFNTDIDVNNILIRDGHVNVLDTAPVQYIQALEYAKRNKRGIWATVVGSYRAVDSNICLSACIIMAGVFILISFFNISRHGNRNISSNKTEET